MGDDIGIINISACNMGLMGIGRRTSTASPGKAAAPACAALITGQSPIRTGLTTAGLPGVGSFPLDNEVF